MNLIILHAVIFSTTGGMRHEFEPIVKKLRDIVREDEARAEAEVDIQQ